MATRFIKSQEAHRNQENYNLAQNGFVQSSKPQRNNTPPPGINSARAAVAETARVKPSTKQKPANTVSAPHSGFPIRHPYPAGRNEYQDQQYQQEQQQMLPAQQESRRDDPFDDTLSTNWDQTKTSLGMDEIPFSQQAGTYPQEYHSRESESDSILEEDVEEDREADDETVQNDIDIPAPEERSPPGLHRKQSRQYLKQEQHDRVRHQANPININRSRPKQQPAAHPNLQIRLGQEEIAASPKSKHLKKRGRSNEPLGGITNPPRIHQRIDEEGFQVNVSVDDFEIGAPSDFQNGGQAREFGEGQTPMEAHNGIESLSQLESPIHEGKLQEFGLSQPPPDTHTPDYTDEELSSMPYAKLKAESWEEVPGTEPYNLPQELSSSNVSMEQKIKFILSLASNDMARAEAFAQMPSDEWKQAGDFILTNIMDLKNKLKEARDKKRRIAEAFEDKLEAREKAVKSKYATYDAKLKDMKVSGEGVLRGKF